MGRVLKFPGGVLLVGNQKKRFPGRTPLVENGNPARFILAKQEFS
jgi:hypothetical protein